MDDSIVLGSSEARYEYFLDSVARGGSICALRCRAGWLFGEGHDGGLVFPVWPSAEAALGTAELLSHAPAPIFAEEWLDSWLEWLIAEGILVGVFPTLRSPGTLVHPGILWAEIIERLE